MDSTAYSPQSAVIPPRKSDHPANPAVQVENLAFFYGDSQVLYDVSIEFIQGSVTALIGPSGCGKSTLLRALNRMHDDTEGARLTGTVRLGSTSIYGREVDLVSLRKRVGMVFQRSNPFPKSIFENVAYGPKIHGVHGKTALAEIVEKALIQADLWKEVKDRLQRNALDLSGGQQQRLCIARALAVEPEVLLMDEPASALDPRSTAKIEELIAQLKGKLTIIIVTHNMQQAARVSDTTAFLYDGHIVECEETSELFSRPREAQTKDYVMGKFG